MGQKIQCPLGGVNFAETHCRRQVLTFDSHCIEENSFEIVTFQEFVKWVIDTNPEVMDSHWRPMYKLCSFCARTYDIILKYENLVLETQQFLKYQHWDSIIPPNVKKYSI